ncbi:MAG: hypothetical protein DDT20_01908 [Firmicutes bacterium]|nr:hypothetical protein [Bacillota bacterium]
MILRGHHGPAGDEVFYGMVAAAVSELELVGVSATGESENLLA